MNYSSFINSKKEIEPLCYKGLNYRQRRVLSAKASGIYMQHHHIIPKSSQKVVDNSNNNLVALTPTDHIIAHVLLYNEDKTNMKNYRTIFLMSKNLVDLDAIKSNRKIIDQFHEEREASKLSIEEINARIKKWSKKATKKYYENNKEKINAKSRLVYAENIEKHREAAKKRVRKYRQKLKEQQQ
jgi:hypothetical protein